MFEAIKKQFAGAKAIGEIGHSFEYLSIQFELLQNKNYDERVYSIVFLYYYFNLEVIEKCDNYNLGPATKACVKKDWIPIGSLMSTAATLFHGWMMKYNLQSEFNDILEKGPLYYEYEEYYKVVKKEAGI